MRRMLPLLSLAVALLGFVAGMMVGGRFDVAPAAAQEEIVVIEHATTDAVVDLGEEGDSVGDTLVFSNELYDADDANVVGSDQGSCVRTKKGEAWECTFTATLADGTITVQGAFYDDGRDTTFAITGGTGDYAGASGEMHLHARSDTEYEFTFEIS
jgi:allene oxide cyclase